MMDDQIVEIASLIHHQWSTEKMRLKTVMNQTDDGSPDWNEYHKVQLESVQARVDKWEAIKNDYIGENREVINKMMGL